MNNSFASERIGDTYHNKNFHFPLHYLKCLINMSILNIFIRLMNFKLHNFTFAIIVIFITGI